MLFLSLLMFEKSKEFENFQIQEMFKEEELTHGLLEAPAVLSLSELDGLAADIAALPLSTAGVIQEEEDFKEEELEEEDFKEEELEEEELEVPSDVAGVYLAAPFAMSVEALNELFSEEDVENFGAAAEVYHSADWERYQSMVSDLGVVSSFKDSVVIIDGITGVQVNELLYFQGGVMGIALNLEYNITRALVFGGNDTVQTSEWVKRSKVVMQVGVGFQLIGRMVNPLGEAIDGLGPIEFTDYVPIEKKAPGVITRKKIQQPLETGLKVIDTLVPIGRGQRELILGDRRSGKTTVAVDSILHQTNYMAKFRKPITCIYVAIGKRMTELAKLSKLLKQRGMERNTVLVVARASDPASLQFIAPYAACTMGEYFTYRGLSALIVYDDLTRHADAYRQISLLLRRPVGREAYPGDIFYLHSRLLERAVKLAYRLGLGSLTALPIVETTQGDVSAYIPTNVISITDGQIYLDLTRHQEGLRPAVDPGISVSRVGSSAQARMMKRLSASLKLELAQFREIEQFSKFGSELDAATRALLLRGRLMIKLLTQPRNKPLPSFSQAVVLYISRQEFFLAAVGRGLINPEAYFRNLTGFLSKVATFLPFRLTLEDNRGINPRLIDYLHTHYNWYTDLLEEWAAPLRQAEGEFIRAPVRRSALPLPVAVARPSETPAELVDQIVFLLERENDQSL